MTITKAVKNGTATLRVEGWLDTQSSPELGREIGALTDVRELILDFERLEYISSSGLREVAAAYRRMKGVGGVFSVIHVRREVMDVFHLTGFDQMLDIRTNEPGEERA